MLKSIEPTFFSKTLRAKSDFPYSLLSSMFLSRQNVFGLLLSQQDRFVRHTNICAKRPGRHWLSPSVPSGPSKPIPLRNCLQPLLELGHEVQQRYVHRLQEVVQLEQIDSRDATLNSRHFRLMDIQLRRELNLSQAHCDPRVLQHLALLAGVNRDHPYFIDRINAAMVGLATEGTGHGKAVRPDMPKAVANEFEAGLVAALDRICGTAKAVR